MSIVAKYPLNGNANDSSGNGLNLTINGATSKTLRGWNGCYFFDGNDYLNGGNILNMGTNDWTCAFWVNPTTITGLHGLVGKTSIATGQRWAIYYRPTTGTIAILIAGSTAGSLIFQEISNTYTPLNTWTHLVGTWDRDSNMALWVNGIKINEWDISALNGVNITNASTPLHIGSYPDNSYLPANFFNGLIDEVALYNHALSPAEVKNLYMYYKGFF